MSEGEGGQPSRFKSRYSEVGNRRPPSTSAKGETPAQVRAADIRAEDAAVGATPIRRTGETAADRAQISRAYTREAREKEEGLRSTADMIPSSLPKEKPVSARIQAERARIAAVQARKLEAQNAATLKDVKEDIAVGVADRQNEGATATKPTKTPKLSAQPGFVGAVSNGWNNFKSLVGGMFGGSTRDKHA